MHYNSNGNNHETNSTFVNKIIKFDTNSPVIDEFRIRTKSGAYLSIITITLILYFIYAEYVFNFEVEVRDHVYPNATAPAGLPLEFDVTLPNVPCALLSIDATDPAGQVQSLHLDKKHFVHKHRLDKNGKRSNMPRKSEFVPMGGTITDATRLEKLATSKAEENIRKQEEILGDCGSCYGAEEDGECCETCDDVKRAYRRRGWHLKLEQVLQCRGEVSAKDEQGEGCQVQGTIALSTGGGNLHLAPGHQMETIGHEDQLSIADVIAYTFESFNVTHTVNKLHFGDNGFPGQIYQLDDESRIVSDGYGMYQYYIQVIPTLYKFLNGTNLQTFQFSVTEHLRHVEPGAGVGLPGIFFFYEVSPLHVVIDESRRGWIPFFTSLCAVVGGVFSVMSMLDKALFDFLQHRKRNRLSY